MADANTVNATEEQSRKLAEDSRETSWKGKSFMRELFLGTLRVDWLDTVKETPESEEFKQVYCALETFLREEVNSEQIDEQGKYPPEVVDGLRALGLFGIKIPKKYGGLGLNQAEYCKLAELIGAHDGSLTALISAHNSIGVPQPIKLFGTEAQKEKYLTMCAKGAISAFALTEPDVGSDPARLSTIATRAENGDYILNGEKLWITNGTFAELMVVMARHDDDTGISAFVVETKTEGFSVGHKCRFMGLKALENGVIHLKNVRVPKENLVGKEGRGLKIALVTLNTGRLSLPAATLGGARKCLEWSREYAATRVQWGRPVGKHEAITHKLADMAATTYAMEAWGHLANELSMLKGYDIRLEAATAKEWGSTRGWDIIDDAMQIKGGRGYETESSLRERGDVVTAIERAMRDARINRIFEGSSEIMHLFMAREMVDKHLKIAGALLEKDATIVDKAKAMPGVIAQYALWYPKLWWGLFTGFKYRKYGKLAKHLRYVERNARKLARNVFHIMVIYQARLEQKQAILFRTVDIAMELAVMVAAVVKAHRLSEVGDPSADKAVSLAELHCANAKRYIDLRFHQLWHNDDDVKYSVGIDVLNESHQWLEDQTRYPESGDLAKLKNSAAK